MAWAPKWNKQSSSKDFRGSRRGHGGHPGNLDAPAVEAPLSFKLKSTVVGLVIGRGGSKIKDIQSSTNTKIHITKGDPEAEVKIFGKKEMKLKAKAAIETIVEKHEERKHRETTRGKGKLPQAAAKQGSVPAKVNGKTSR